MGRMSAIIDASLRGVAGRRRGFFSARALRCGLAVFGLFAAGEVNAKMAMTFGGWFPERRDDFVTLQRYWRTFDSVSLFYYGAAADGSVYRVVPAEETGMIGWAQSKGIKVFATIGGTPPVLPGAFSGPNRDRCIGEIVKLCEKFGYDGFDIDFEGIDSQARTAFTEFIAALALALKAMSPPRLLSVTVQDFPGAEDEASMAFDYRELAIHADYVRVMCYDYSWQKAGPIMPREWFGRVLDFSRSRIPKEKFVAALPWYGRDWIPADDTHQDILFGQREALTGLAGYQELLSRHKATPVWDEAGGEYWFRYAREGKEHVVWMPEHDKFSWMVDEVKKRGAAGLYVWHVAYSDPGSWKVLAEKLGAPAPAKEGADTVVAGFPGEGKRIKFGQGKGGSLKGKNRADVSGAALLAVQARVPAGVHFRVSLGEGSRRGGDGEAYWGPPVAGTGEWEEYLFSVQSFVPADTAGKRGDGRLGQGAIVRWEIKIAQDQGRGAAWIRNLRFIPLE